jgi:hypothetical protein
VQLAGGSSTLGLSDFVRVGDAADLAVFILVDADSPTRLKLSDALFLLAGLMP